jgi:hypothetical protein
MVKRKCKLCFEEKMLCESHLMPRALYRMTRGSGSKGAVERVVEFNGVEFCGVVSQEVTGLRASIESRGDKDRRQPSKTTTLAFAGRAVAHCIFSHKKA